MNSAWIRIIAPNSVVCFGFSGEVGLYINFGFIQIQVMRKHRTTYLGLTRMSRTQHFHYVARLGYFAFCFNNSSYIRNQFILRTKLSTLFVVVFSFLMKPSLAIVNVAVHFRRVMIQNFNAVRVLQCNV
ncbi:hypothetical protein VNO77_32275 [Canavalia gladiata]|uniref:Uncharacterized protein n=1 Tax=Canavalia gladiata TaxID=3824 RepID=A0AAN9KSH3_CANGL